MRIYYGSPFGSIIANKNNKLNDRDIHEISTIASFVRKLGHEVFSPAEAQRFIAQSNEPDTVTGREFEYMKFCDVAVIKPGDPPSGGAHVQIGWASAFGKPIIILIEGGKKYSTLVRGLDAIINCEYVDITQADNFEKLKLALEKSQKIISDMNGNQRKTTTSIKKG